MRTVDILYVHLYACSVYISVFSLAVFLWALLPEIKWMMMTIIIIIALF